MIKLLQHVRDWTASPDTDGVATAVFNAWQSPEAKKADVSAPDATKATRAFLAEHVVETASLHECH